MATGELSGKAGADAAGADAPARPGKQARLFLASFSMLFTELWLIRWITANNVFVTEATNFVLLASFLGIGIGFLNARSGRDFVRWSPLALLAVVAFVLGFPVILHTGPTPFLGAGHAPALPRPVSFAGVFVLTAAVMAGLGQAVARLFVGFGPLNAYRLDILGSIAGITLFSVLSFLDQPPAVWGAVGVAGLAGLLLPRIRWWQVVALAGVIALLCIESSAAGQTWSPYNKLVLAKQAGHPPVISVTANNIPFQSIYSLAHMHAHERFYFLPYRHLRPHSLGSVLIIGAGTGNDVAVALAEGARHVDAVEIDPRLLAAGRQLHPGHPYESPRVTAHVADGRQYLQDTSKHYNLILFALPDSLTALAGQSGIRLESYLLTKQSVAAARARLAPGGMFAMYNYYAPFVLDRYATTVEDVFHRAPCAQVGGLANGRRLAVLMAEASGSVPGCTSLWHGQKVNPATDDWPFPYLRSPAIPALYLWILAAILLGSLLLVRALGGSFRQMGSYADLAFMGAAFLLLETKSLVSFALLFGTTWFVNALVFAGVLVAVYLAVELARWVRLPPAPALYGALIAALALAWVVPQESLLGLPVVPRFLAASALAFAPVFLANLIFAQRFASVAASATAFAANLLGAMVGGTLEYLSLITGYRFLLIIVALLYGLAYVTGLRFRRQAA